MDERLWYSYIKIIIFKWVYHIRIVASVPQDANALPEEWKSIDDTLWVSRCAFWHIVNIGDDRRTEDCCFVNELSEFSINDKSKWVIVPLESPTTVPGKQNLFNGSKSITEMQLTLNRTFFTIPITIRFTWYNKSSMKNWMPTQNCNAAIGINRIPKLFPTFQRL